MPFTTVVSMWVVTAGRTVVVVTAIVNLALVDRWICIAVAADGALAWFFHVSDTDRPLPVALRPLGAAGGPTTVMVKDWAPEPATFVAVILNGYVPPVPAVGVPASVAVTVLVVLEPDSPAGVRPSRTSRAWAPRSS